MTTNYLSVNSTVSDTLGEAGDFYAATQGYYYDFYLLTDVTPGVDVTISVESGQFDTWVSIYNSGSGEIVQQDSNGGAGTNALTSFTPTFGDQDSYMVLVSSENNSFNATGAYSVSAFQG